MERDRVVTLEAVPGPVVFTPRGTAAVVVDMQNDFAAKGGMFDRGGIDISLIRRAIEPTARALASLRKAHIPVIYLKMGYRPDLSDLGSIGSPNRDRHLAFSVGAEVTDPRGRPRRILIRDTWNTAILDELAPRAGDLELYKTRYSGFYATELDSILRARSVKWLILAGCTTSVCVESTIRDAMFRDYSCVLLTDCTAEPIGNELPRTNQEASQLVVQALFGWTATSTALIHALETMES